MQGLYESEVSLRRVRRQLRKRMLRLYKPRRWEGGWGYSGDGESGCRGYRGTATLERRMQRVYKSKRSGGRHGDDGENGYTSQGGGRGGEARRL